ncbi:MAG: IS5 family transposase [Alphaproteobacteria bacterium]|nr:IS5 family transposase [Alphaproteobacteria bacterium]
MRGDDRQPDAMFSYVSPERRVPADHPLRAIRRLVDEVLGEMSAEFDGLYARVGRPSIPPERLLRAQLLQVFYSIRSERLLMEQLDYNLLFRWFVGLSLDDPIWVPTVFTKNRDRLLTQDVARSFFRRVVERAAGLLSDEHFTVDGTLIEAWAGQKSFHRKDGDGDGGHFRGQTRRNDTHASTTDPDARLYRKGRGMEARLTYLGHLLIENRHGLIVDAMATQADGTAEREAATVLLAAQAARAPGRRRTVGADKAYDTKDFVEWARALGVTPHVTQNAARRGGSAIDGRTTRHDGYAQSQHARPRVEPAFGWLKSIAWMRKVKLRGLAKVDWLFVFASAAFNLIRLPKLLPESA